MKDSGRRRSSVRQLTSAVIHKLKEVRVNSKSKKTQEEPKEENLEDSILEGDEFITMALGISQRAPNRRPLKTLNR